MGTFLTILLGFALAAVLGALGFGLFTLLKGDDYSLSQSNTAMRWRVLLQGFALLIFFLLLLLGR